MELVACASLAALNLLLRTLRLRKYHGTRDRDVYTFPNRDTCRWRTAVSGRALAGVLLKPRRITHSLRHNTRTDILRRRLHIATNLVDPRPDRIFNNDHSLESGGIHLVENS